MDGSHASNPYLSGNFAPVRSEDDFVLEIAGEMPKGLNGAFYRNGPNPQFEPRDAHHHWFAGDGMIHGVFVEDGKASYRNRYVQTPKYLVEREAGRSLFGSFTNPASTLPAPSSTKRSTPISVIACTDSRQRTVFVTCSTNKAAIPEASVAFAAVTLAMMGSKGAFGGVSASASAMASAAERMSAQ